MTYHRDTEGETHRGRHVGREATCGVGVGDELNGWSSCFDSWAMRLHVCVIMPSFPGGFTGSPVMVSTWLSYFCLVMYLSLALFLTLEIKRLLKAYTQDWRDDSPVIKSTSFTCRGLGFYWRHPHYGLQLSVSSCRGSSTFGLSRHQAFIWWTYTYPYNISTYTMQICTPQTDPSL